jgi:hypothetical protein
LAPDVRRDDLWLQEPTGDRYWLSEYRTAAGLVQFRCGLILHFIEATGTAGIEVYETVPTVWVGEHWAMTAHGVGFGRYHDIRFVEPTVRERLAILDVVNDLVRQRR